MHMSSLFSVLTSGYMLLLLLQRKKQELIDRLTDERDDTANVAAQSAVDLQQDRLGRSVHKAKMAIRQREAANVRRIMGIRKHIDFEADQAMRRKRIKELDDLRPSATKNGFDSDVWKVRLPDWSETREESIREAMDVLRTEVTQVKNGEVRHTLDDELNGLQTIVGA
jgi:hypothetical protein